jgi:hypothetical protein
MGVLSTRTPAAVLPTKCPTNTGGVAREPGRDIRENIEGDRKA